MYGIGELYVVIDAATSIEDGARTDGDLSLHSNLSKDNRSWSKLGRRRHPRGGMHEHGQVIAGVLKLLDPVKTRGGMADGHNSGGKRWTGIGLQSQSQRAHYGPTQDRRAGIRAGATVVEESNTRGHTTGKGRFRYHLGVTTGPQDQKAAHSRTAVPMKGCIVASPAALMPSRRITFQIVSRKMRRSSQKLC